MEEERRCDGAGPSSAVALREAHSNARVVLLSGAASGLLARFFTHPLDTVKARLQVQSAVSGRAAGRAPQPLPYAGTADALRKLARAEGVAGFYRGFSAVATAVPLASAVYFGGYELTKSLLQSSEGGAALPPSAVYVASGVVAQACAGVVYCPMDVVKERMQVQQMLLRGSGSGASARPPPVMFASSAACFASILRAEGPRGAWRGYWAANAAWWPWNVLYFVTYERLRDAAADRMANGDKSALPPLVSATAATAAAALATVVTNPVDVVKTRLQALPGGAGAAGGALGVARAMYAAEGSAVFAAGLSARVLSIAPGSFIAFFAFESIRAAIAAREAREAHDRDSDAPQLAALA